MVISNSSSKSLKTRSSRMRNVNAKTSNLSLGTSLGGISTFSSELSSKAGQNGIGIVYNRSDCSYPHVSSYAFGGPSWVRGSYCDAGWVNQDPGWTITQFMSDADIIWFGVLNDPYKTIANFRSKTPGSTDHNWSIPDLTHMQRIIHVACSAYDFEAGRC